MLAKFVVAGLRGASETTSEKFILFADKLSKMPYKESHRGRYKGRWWREGLYEVLMDVQTRINRIGNEIAQGLEWASKTFFVSDDIRTYQNIMSDMRSGDIIKSKDAKQLEVRMQGFDQLAAEWNRLIELANRLSNAREVVQGETMPSGTPFRLGALLNQNAGKLYDFIREKLALAFQSVLEDWVLPDLLKDMKAKEVLQITGESGYLKRYYEMLAESWYVKNLVAIGPHTPEQAQFLKEQKIKELSKSDKAEVKAKEGWLEGVKARMFVVITGENVRKQEELESLANFIGLEQDSVRRTALLEIAIGKAMLNIDVASLPKSEPQQTASPAGLAGRATIPARATLAEGQPA